MTGVNLKRRVSLHSYVLEKVDLVIVGAEGVVESGGIINKVSSDSSTSY